MTKKEELLAIIEATKKDIEDGRVTNLILAGCDEKGGISTHVVANGIASLGLVEFLSTKVKKMTFAQADQQDLQKKLLDMFDGDHN